MKTLCTLAFVMLSFFNSATVNKPVSNVDLSKFSGKWYSLYSIPTMFDKGTQQTVTTYTLNSEGYYNVVTEAHKGDDNELKTYHSKLFPVEHTNNAEMKAQFVWPFKVDYWVIELGDDYSYVVVGHPDHKFLFIMSRTPTIDHQLYQDILARCKARGYDVSKLTCQNHHHA